MGTPGSGEIESDNVMPGDSNASAPDVREARRLPLRDRGPHRCPGCSRPLTWIERGRIGGISYEYFHWCPGGCGLYCFDCEARRYVKLA